MSDQYRDVWVPIVEMWGALTFIPAQYPSSYECWKHHPSALAVINLKKLIQYSLIEGVESKGGIQ